MPLVLLKFHLNGPLTYLPAPAPLMAAVDVLEIVKVFPLGVNIPFVKVRVPATVFAALNVTPFVLLMVKLLIDVGHADPTPGVPSDPFTVVCAALELLYTSFKVVTPFM